METAQKKYKKLRKTRIWPTILIFLLSLIVGTLLLLTAAGFYVVYVVQNRFVESNANVQKIAAVIEQQTKMGDSYEDALKRADALIGEEAIGIYDKEDKLLASKGEITAELNWVADFDLDDSKDEQIYLDGDATRLIDVEETYGVEVRNNNIQVDMSDIIALTLSQQQGDIWDLSQEGFRKNVLEYVYWLAVPVGKDGDRMLMRCTLNIQKADVFYGIGITGVVGAFFVIILTIQFSHGVSILLAQRKKEKLLMLDPVTGGDNWMAFEQKTLRKLRGRRNAAKSYALVDFSVMKYQGYCSLHGVKEGERLLTQVNQFLMRELKKTELAARVARADFVLLLDCENTEAGRQEVLDRIQHLFTEFGHGIAHKHGKNEKDVKDDHGCSTMTFQAGVYFVTPSLKEDGKTITNRKRINVEKLYISAGIAKNSITEEGSSVCCFTHQMWEDQLWQHKVEDTMQAALDAEEFQVYVQPKYNPVTEKLAGAEALVRWKSPTEGMVPPGKFIPIFEKTGFVTQLDDYMISHVAKLQSQWLAEGKKIVPISVNVSRAHFAQPDLAEHIRDLVDQYQVPHEYVEIELTESAFFDDKRALLTTVHKLQDYGFDVSMDDFGSGYSSLNSLKDLPLNVLKLDAEFFRGDDFDTRGEIVVSEAINLAKHLNMKIVAEGVEKKEQVDFLAKQDCDMIQGYYFAKPMPADEYEQRLEK